MVSVDVSPSLIVAGTKFFVMGLATTVIVAAATTMSSVLVDWIVKVGFVCAPNIVPFTVTEYVHVVLGGMVTPLMESVVAVLVMVPPPPPHATEYVTPDTIVKPVGTARAKMSARGHK